MHSPHIPSELNYVVNRILKTPINDMKKVIETILPFFQQNNYASINVQSFATKLNMNLQEIEDLFGVLFILIRWCHQLRLHSDKEIKQDLVECGFTGEWATNFLNFVMIKSEINKTSNYDLQMKTLKWRIDISLTNNTLKRVMAPTIIWNIKLSNGKQYTIEISMRKYHELRFNITTLLKDLRIVKNNSLVKK